MTQTYRIALITKTTEGQTTIDLQGVPMNKMKEQILRIVKANKVPASAILLIIDEMTNKIYFRNLLSSVPSLVNA